MTFSSADITVVPPTSTPLGGWVYYEMHVCDGTTCQTQNCTNIAAPANTTCPLSGLTPSTAYRVYAVAVAGTIRTLDGNNDTFTTESARQAGRSRPQRTVPPLCSRCRFESLGGTCARPSRLAFPAKSRPSALANLIPVQQLVAHADRQAAGPLGQRAAQQRHLHYHAASRGPAVGAVQPHVLPGARLRRLLDRLGPAQCHRRPRRHHHLHHRRPERQHYVLGQGNCLGGHHQQRAVQHSRHPLFEVRPAPGWLVSRSSARRDSGATPVLGSGTTRLPPSPPLLPAACSRLGEAVP